MVADSDKRPRQIQAFWTCPVTGWPQPYNIGIAAGGDLVVIDIDNKNDKTGSNSLRLLEAFKEPLPPTRTVRTPSGGEHRYFKSDIAIGNSASRVADGVDVRGEGGYVVGPGSVIDGKPYEVVDNSPTADLPRWLQTMAATTPRVAKAAAGEVLGETDTPDAIARAIDWLRNRAPDHGTYAVAARVKDFGISQEMCKELVKEQWVDARGLAKDDDHIDFRVENAYRYGQNPVGIASPEAEFDAVDIGEVEPVAKPRLYYEFASAISVDDGSAPPLIEDWFDQGAMVVIYGDSGSGKTHIALSQAVAIAAGQPWAGHAVSQGLVVYVAAEGGRGIRKRISAHLRHVDKSIPLALVPCPIDLLRPAGDTAPLIQLLKNAEAEAGQTCKMVVVDTLSRALAGGNENAPDDMGAFVKHCDRIRAATGACVNIIHHSGKNAAAGARGHSLLRAATDTEIEIAGGAIKATKQRDMEASRQLTFTLQQIDLGRDKNGRHVTTALPHIGRSAPEVEFSSSLLTSQQERLYQALESAVREHVPANERDNTDILRRTGIPTKAWSDKFASVHGELAPTSFKRWREKLKRAGLVQSRGQENSKGLLWFLASVHTVHDGPEPVRGPAALIGPPDHPPLKEGVVDRSPAWWD